MRNLVNALEEAAEGSAVLDLRIGRDLQREQIAVTEPAIHGLMAELSAETVENIVGEMVVPFTRSLDAGLPGENIVFCIRCCLFVGYRWWCWRARARAQICFRSSGYRCIGTRLAGKLLRQFAQAQDGLG
mgnify:CR=1 FL=1